MCGCGCVGGSWQQPGCLELVNHASIIGLAHAFWDLLTCAKPAPDTEGVGESEVLCVLPSQNRIHNIINSNSLLFAFAGQLCITHTSTDEQQFHRTSHFLCCVPLTHHTTTQANQSIIVMRAHSSLMSGRVRCSSQNVLSSSSSSKLVATRGRSSCVTPLRVAQVDRVEAVQPDDASKANSNSQLGSSIVQPKPLVAAADASTPTTTTAPSATSTTTTAAASANNSNPVAPAATAVGLVGQAASESVDRPFVPVINFQELVDTLLGDPEVVLKGKTLYGEQGGRKLWLIRLW